MVSIACPYNVIDVKQGDLQREQTFWEISEFSKNATRNIVSFTTRVWVSQKTHDGARVAPRLVLCVRTATPVARTCCRDCEKYHLRINCYVGIYKKKKNRSFDRSHNTCFDPQHHIRVRAGLVNFTETCVQVPKCYTRVVMCCY